MTEFVNASPAKRFFVEMLIRDIRLEDAILDLVDNSIDSLIRHDHIDLLQLLTTLTESTQARDDIPIKRQVSIQIQNNKFQYQDNCGGIRVKAAKESVFRFGAQQKLKDTHLSVYGIGLKRAALKIGRHILVESKTLKSGFRVTMDVDKFEQSNDQWKFPIEPMECAKNSADVGTRIVITKITDESKTRLSSPSFESNLVASIQESYSLFLEELVTIQVVKPKSVQIIKPKSIPISNSEELATSLLKLKYNSVDVTIIAGLQSLEKSDWRGQTAGWYIVCNGRVVVFADKTTLTGWGVALPAFQPKHRGFIGIALFMSADPEALPWTTTKRGVNAESAVYQFVRERMILQSRPVIKFLNSRYSKVPISSENTENLEVQDTPLRAALKKASMAELLTGDERPFRIPKNILRKSDTISVQYRTTRKNIERGGDALGDRGMAAGKVGLRALEYFLDNESE